LGTGAPQSMPSAVPAGGHCGSHSQTRAAVSHRWPAPHPPAQRPPQPSSEPQGEAAVHRGVQAQEPVARSQRCRGSLHAPGQRPPQPSSAPHDPSGSQRGVHTQAPKTQRSLAPRTQGVGQLQVPRQAPLMHVSPTPQRTLAQGLTTQRPSTQNSVSAHVTPSHGEGGTHWMWHAVPSGHIGLHGWMGSHAPELREQYWPVGHVTPAHGER
jgi:hypothetical protein